VRAEKNGFSYGRRSISLDRLNTRYGLTNRDFLNITELDNTFLSRIRPGQGGSLLTLTAEEIQELSSKNLGFASQYRQSQFLKLFDANIAVAEDKAFNAEIFNIYEERYGTGSYETEAARLRTSSGRAMSDAEIAYRSSAKILGEEVTGSKSYNAAYDAVAKLHQRTTLNGLGAENGLGSYVNTLGWAASTEKQRLDALARLEAEGYGSIANSLRSKLIPMFNPEAAIDPSIGGSGVLSFGGSLQDMYDAVRIFHGENAGLLTESQIRETVNKSVFNLIGREKENINSFAQLYSEFDSSQNAAEWAKAFSASREEHLAAFGRLAADEGYAKRLTGLIDVSTKAVSENMVLETARMTGEIRATQILLGYGEDDLIGFDRLISNTKLSSRLTEIPGTGEMVYEPLNYVIQGYQRALKNMPEGASPEAIAQIKRTISTLAAVAEDQALSGVRKRAALLDVMELRGRAKEVYGFEDLPTVAKEFQKISFQYRDMFNKGKRSIISEGILQGSINEIKNDAIKNLIDDTGLESPLKQLIENEVLLKEIEEKTTLSTKSKTYHALVRAKLLDEGLFEVDQRAALASAVENIRMAKATAVDSIAETVLSGFQREANGPVKLNELMRALDVRITNLQASEDIEERKLAQFLREALETENAAMNVSINVAKDETRQLNLNRLYSYSKNENIVQSTNVAKSETENIVNILRELGGAEEGEDVFSREYFAKIGKFNEAEVMAEESGRYLTTPDIIRAEGQESVEQVIERMRVTKKLVGGGQADLDQVFIEDLLALSVTDSDTAEQSRKLIAARFSEEEGQKYLNRLDLIRARYNALRVAQTEQMQDVAELGSRGIDVTSAEVTSIDDYLKRVLEAHREAAGAPRLEDDMARSFAETADTVAGSKYTRIGDMLKDLFTSGKPLGERGSLGPLAETAFKNKGKIAGVAAIATGLAIFGHIKSKDHSEQAISGPPLLPGGNPYEQMPVDPMLLQQAPIASGGQGTSYNISVNGDQEQMEEFMNRARISNKWTSKRYYA
jgi:hypothetical protein